MSPRPYKISPVAIGAFTRTSRLRRSRTIHHVTWGLVLLAVSWRTVRYLMKFPLWGDEAFLAMSILTRSARGMVGSLEYGQIAPIGFMLCEWLVTRVAGVTEMGLRFLPYLIGLATVWLYWGLAAAMVGPRTTMICVAVFAAAYFPTRYGVELKPYGLDLLVALVLLRLALWMLKAPQSVGRGLALSAATAAGVWFSYPSAFVAGAIGLVMTRRLLRQPDRRLLGVWAVYGVGLLSSFFLMLRIQANPQLQSSPWYQEIPMWTRAFPPVKDPLKFAWWLVDTHVGELLAYPVGGRHGASTIPFLLVVVGSAALWRKNREQLLLLLGPLPLMFVAAAMHRYPYGGGPRVSLFMAPAFCLLVGCGLAVTCQWWDRRRRQQRARPVVVIALASMAVAGIVRDVFRPYVDKSYVKCRAAIGDIARRTQPDDGWVIFNSLTDSSTAPNLYAWGGSGAAFRYYVTHLAPVSVSWAPRPDGVKRADSGRIWLLAYHDNKVPFPQNQFDAYLAACGAIWGPSRRDSYGLGGDEAIETYSFDHPETGIGSRDRTRTSGQ
jgi:hypothetical protein